jgi:ankyrin repeat protein
MSPSLWVCFNDTLHAALHKAVVNGHTACAEVLLGFGSQINTQNMGGDTPFRKAVYHGHTDCARMLIEKGAEYNFVSEKNISPLHLAVFKGTRTAPSSVRWCFAAHS